MAKPKTGTRGKRRSKAENFTEAKANAVEVRKLGGDNAPELKLPAREDFEYHMKSIRGAVEKKDTAVSLVRLAHQSAEKSCKGLGKTIDRLIKLERSDDTMAFHRELELLGYGLKLTNSPVQLTVFDTLQGDVEEQAYKRGLSAGKAGKTADNRYPDGSDLAEEYSKGWRHGQAENLGLSPEQSDAAIAEGNGNGDGRAPWPDDAEAGAAAGATH